jgi:hypothetical protein
MTSHRSASNDSSAAVDDYAVTDPMPTADTDGSLVVTAVAGIAAFGVSMAVRPALKALYRTATGHQPPNAEDPAAPFAKALVWTVVSAATGAVLEMMVQRATRRFLEARH